MIKKLIFYGLGKDGKEFLQKCRLRKIFPDLIVDKNENLYGNMFEGINVISPEKLREYKKPAIVVITSRKYYEEIYNDLKAYEWFSVMSMDYYDYILNSNIDLEKTSLTQIESQYKSKVEDYLKKSNKNVLFADITVLKPDTNAGARASMGYLKEILSAGWNVIFLPTDFMYSEGYVEKMENDGALVLWGLHRKKWIYAYLCENIENIQINFVNRPNVVLCLEDYLKISRAKLVYFGHDIHYVRLRREFEISKRSGLKEEADNMEKIEKEIIRHASVSGYPSTAEVNLLKKDLPNANIQYFPLYSFERHEPTVGLENRQGMVFVGGFGHRPNIDAVMWFCKEILPLIRENGIQDKFYIVGSNPPEEVCNLANDDVVVTGYVSDVELEKYYRICRLAVVPLRFGAGMKGKLLEAMDHGMPIVTTAIGCEGLKDHEDCMGIADTVTDFAEKVIEICQNSDVAKEYGVKSQEYIQEYFGASVIKDIVNGFLNR